MPDKGYDAVTVKISIIRMIDKIKKEKENRVYSFKSRGHVVETAVRLLAEKEKIDIRDCGDED